MARTIPLTRGFVTVVDDDDYEYLCRWDWHAQVDVREGNDLVYAVRGVWNGGRYYLIHLHREVLQPPEGKYVDHINGNPLDNRRANLRICTNAQNQANRRKQRAILGKPPRSRYKGVRTAGGQQFRNKPWRACIKTAGKNRSLGYYSTEEEAARAYDRAAREAWGDYARLNFPVDGTG
jgi:hypothetical protein